MMKKILKTVVRMLGFLFVSVLIGYCIFLVNAKFVLHEQLPMICGYGNAVVLSGSMEPNISVNDLLIIKKCDDYKVGDIITFVDTHNDLVTHRIIKVNGSEITAQGDANNVSDPIFNIERIKGKVVAVLPQIGYVITFIQNPFCVVCIIIFTFILMEHSYSKEKKNKDTNIESIKAQIDVLKKELETESKSDEFSNNN